MKPFKKVSPLKPQMVSPLKPQKVSSIKPIIMKKQNKPLSPAEILRQKAEEKLKLLTNTPSGTSQFTSEAEKLKMIHELHVHQLELEMQNEELSRAISATQDAIELYDFAPSGYFRLSKEGDIVALNLSGANMIGKERHHLINSRFGFFVSDDTKQIFNVFLEKIFRSKTKETCEVMLETNSNPTLHGQLLPIYVHFDGIISENDEQCLLSMVDITQRKQAEIDLIKAKEHAEESDRLKTAFLQNVSHEIRTPMNAIIGFTTMLEKQELTEEKRKNFITIILKNSNHLLSIVNDILTIASIETKQVKVSIQKVCIKHIINDLLETFKLQATDRKISLNAKTPFEDKDSEIYTDKAKVIQILTNLLTNAIKFTHEGFVEFGYMMVETQNFASPQQQTQNFAPLQQIQFYVKDTGIGIPQEIQHKIFERFRQVDISINKKYEGTGLGLSISKGFVELLGGKI